MAVPTRVIAAAGAVFIDGLAVPMPAGTLRAAMGSDGATITIGNIMGGPALAAGPWTAFTDGDGHGFTSAAAAMAYLAATLAPARTGPFQEALQIVEQNAIPPLSRPWRAGPGAFANIIIGLATMVSGQGAVTFADGSDAVAFDAAAAGFNLDPGDVVIAQYST